MTENASYNGLNFFHISVTKIYNCSYSKVSIWEMRPTVGRISFFAYFVINAWNP